jgi:maltodextrin utilization protein YvdJ
MTLLSITDALTNDTITREMTDEELAQRQKDKNEQAAIDAKHKAETKAKADARAVILDRLGLTADEAAILLG